MKYHFPENIGQRIFDFYILNLIETFKKPILTASLEEAFIQSRDENAENMRSWLQQQAYLSCAGEIRHDEHDCRGFRGLVTDYLEDNYVTKRVFSFIKRLGYSPFGSSTSAKCCSLKINLTRKLFVSYCQHV